MAWMELDDKFHSSSTVPQRRGLVATRRDGDGLLVGVRWDDDREERMYRLTIAAAEGESAS